MNKAVCVMRLHGQLIHTVLFFLAVIGLTWAEISDDGSTAGTDLCSTLNGHKLVVEPGQSGIITASNITSPTELRNSTAGPPQRCSVQLTTHPDSHLVVTILRLAIPACSPDLTCRCDYLWIKEPSFSKSGREFCGIHTDTSPAFISKTKLVELDLIYSFSYSEAFAVLFKAARNKYTISGAHGYQQPNSSGTIESPHFPMRYPRDYSAIYRLENLDPNGFVQITFQDFQLAPWSYVEVKDSDGTELGLYDGSLFRPPALISTGPILTLRFKANNDYPNIGFRAKYTFVNYPEKYWQQKPNTDCGGYLEETGGVITMVGTSPTVELFDCVWILPARVTYNMESHLAIRVAKFHHLGPKSTLEIRQGTTSSSVLVESLSGYHLRGPSPRSSSSQEVVVSATTGFYVHLHGYFNNLSHLSLVYSAFRYEDCYSSDDFRCENGRCIKVSLHCDGFNHCGDGSDEATCFGPGAPKGTSGRWWHSLSPSYYYPAGSTTSRSSTSTLILVSSLAGLGMFLLTTLAILVRLHRAKHRQGAPPATLRTISGGDLSPDGGFAHFEGTGHALYDAPPPYDEVVKVCTPPPAYHSVAGSQRRGFDNAAYIPDPVSRALPGRPHLLRIPLTNRCRNLLTGPLRAPRNIPPAPDIYRSERLRGAKIPTPPPCYQSLPRNLLCPLQTRPKPRRSPLPILMCHCKGACSCPSQHPDDGKPLENPSKSSTEGLSTSEDSTTNSSPCTSESVISYGEGMSSLDDSIIASPNFGETIMVPLNNIVLCPLPKDHQQSDA